MNEQPDAPMGKREKTPAERIADAFVGTEGWHEFEVVLHVRAFGKSEVVAGGIRKTLERVLSYALPGATIRKVKRASR